MVVGKGRYPAVSLESALTPFGSGRTKGQYTVLRGVVIILDSGNHNNNKPLLMFRGFLWMVLSALSIRPGPDNYAGVNMKEKRVMQRRNYEPANKFPMTDKSGCIVPFDRSRIADRRLNILVLKELKKERFA